MPRRAPDIGLRPFLGEIVAAAQEVYDAWEPDEDGFDEEYGTGGICDDVAEAVAGVLAEHGFDAGTFHYDNENHTVATVTIADRGFFEVDIPFQVYERGSYYHYTKIPDVVIVAADVVVTELEFDPNEDY